MSSIQISKSCDHIKRKTKVDLESLTLDENCQWRESMEQRGIEGRKEART